MKARNQQSLESRKTPDFESDFLPGLAIDTVIFGFHSGQIRILLLTYENTGLFALPGGFIYKKESLNDAAKRVLLERTSLNNIYLDQFYTFGDISRDDPGPMRKIMMGKGLE